MDEALIVVNVQAGQVHELNSTAAWLWDRLARCGDVGRLVEEFCDHYEVSRERAQQDIERVLEELLQRGLLLKEQP